MGAVQLGAGRLSCPIGVTHLVAPAQFPQLLMHKDIAT